MVSTNTKKVYKKISGAASLVNFLGNICHSLICGGANMVDESDDKIREPRSKHHITARDIPMTFVMTVQSMACAERHSQFSTLQV